MKLTVFSALFGMVAGPLFAEHDQREYGNFAEPRVNEPAVELPETPLKLSVFLEWTAVSFPTAENVVVLSDRTIQIGSRVYSN